MKIKNFAKKQMMQTMLTSIPQIVKVKGYHKWMKTLVLLACLSGCSYQVWTFMQVYWTYPIIVDVFISNPKVLSAPAFTLCEYNGIRKKFFCRSYPELCSPQMSYINFCAQHFQYCSDFPKEEPTENNPTITPEELPTNISYVRHHYRKLGIQGHLLIGQAYFGKEELMKPKPVSVFNYQHLPTNCFAFNTLWGNSSAVLGNVNERDFFEITVRISDDNFYTTTPVAIQMAVHSPFMKVDPFTTGFSIQPCSTYNMYLKKTVKYLLPAPYRTNCTDYKKLWRDRGGFGPLNQKMCIDECVLNKSMAKYDCFNPVYVSYPTEDELFCFKEPYDDFYSDCLENCQQACYEEDIEVKVEEFIYSSTEVDSKKKQCVTGIKLLFVRMEVMTFTYSKKYQDVEAFGYIGGLLGVWLGLSLVAVFDFLETCFMIFIFCIKKLMKEERKKSEKLTYINGFKREVLIV